MNGEILRAARIAEALLAGPWDLKSLTGRLKTTFHAVARSRWPRQTAVELVAEFPAPPRAIRLAFWITRNRHLAPRQKDVPLADLPRPRMRPHPAAASLLVPALCTPGDIAAWLRLDPGQVDGLAGAGVPERRRHARARNYAYRWLKKSDGRVRLIESPKWRLMAVQRQILSDLLDHVPPHPAAHAFVRGRSLQTFLSPHVRRNWVLRLDLADFFATIAANRVVEVFRFLGYPEASAQWLTRLCVNAAPSDVLCDGIGHAADAHVQRLRSRLSGLHLPQGAPTSPALANLCLFRFDQRLARLAESRGLQYTRYCDDLVFSGDRETRSDVVDLRRTLFMILADERLSVRHAKTRIMPAGRRQNVCGLNLNHGLNTPRAAFDQLRAILHRCGTKGLTAEEQQDSSRFRQHLQGRIAWVSSINPHRQAKLVKLFEAIAW
ncbi:Reverse transcriptase (RNA-dependent DNA polymerase) [Caulifigura coniformis]|uniref:RNA-directed DNA polymerase n=1 Tax=Caulifigura coniformis TaxID=2527983 RepID=A0A517SDW0_9PLAN|nr:reverse transcriptase family protein [Caulifigura coniformis]QDT54310.1 Reverse transcriptase (RNA-dependent DNA polymerase) [Caulifigura coniformis]